jgi:pyruvyl transferase EpsO
LKRYPFAQDGGLSIGPGRSDAASAHEVIDDSFKYRLERPLSVVSAQPGRAVPGAPFVPEKALSELRAHIESLVEDRPVAILDWPHYANAGDHFIWLGQKVLFKGLLKKKVELESPITGINFQKLTNLPRNTVFVFQGGGNFGDLYEGHQRFRESIIAAFPERRMILMPQSIQFETREGLVRARDNLRRHPDLHVFARDASSFDILRNKFNLKYTYLGIDGAFYLQNIIEALVARFPPANIPVVRLLRNDKEKGAESESARSAGAAKDWSNVDDLDPGKDDPLFDLQECGIDHGRALSGPLDTVSWRRLCGAVKLFASAEQIVTDRLHGHILCVLMKKPHIALDNSYGKVSAFYDTWESETPQDVISRPSGSWRKRLAFWRSRSRKH